MHRPTPIGDLPVRRLSGRGAGHVPEPRVVATAPGGPRKRISYVRLPYIRMPGLRAGYVQIRYVRMAG